MKISTQLLKINVKTFEPEKARKMIEVLKRDGVIVYPTDTFYGLGANCFSEKAIEKIYRIKKREPSKPLSLVVADLQMLEELVTDIPHVFYSIGARFWPGPLTVILKASSRLPEAILGPSRTIGVRVPALSWLRDFLREASFPLTATSANISGQAETSVIEEARRVFEGKVELIVDGGKTRGGLPSTVLDLSSGRPKILREGAIKSSSLKEYLSSS